MSADESSNKKNVIAIVVIVIALVAAVGIFALTRSGGDQAPDRPRQQWFYDLGNGQLFTVGVEVKAPVDAPSGTMVNNRPGGVKAHLFSCGDCSKEAERFIGYLSVPTAQAAADPRGASYLREENLMIAEPNPDDPQDVQWSPLPNAINRINAALRERCGGEMPRECHP